MTSDEFGNYKRINDAKTKGNCSFEAGNTIYSLCFIGLFPSDIFTRPNVIGAILEIKEPFRGFKIEGKSLYGRH